MATVRLQRRRHRPPRRRLRAAGNGPRARGHARPAPRPAPRRAPGLRRRAPRCCRPRPPARPPAARKPAASPRTSMAPHTSSSAKVSPRGAGGQKPLPGLARTSGGRPARACARGPPSARGARTGTWSSLFSVQPGAAYAQHQDVGCFPAARPGTPTPGRLRTARPRVRSPVLPPSPRLQAHFRKVLSCP